MYVFYVQDINGHPIDCYVNNIEDIKQQLIDQVCDTVGYSKDSFVLEPTDDFFTYDMFLSEKYQALKTIADTKFIVNDKSFQDYLDLTNINDLRDKYDDYYLTDALFEYRFDIAELLYKALSININGPFEYFSYLWVVCLSCKYEAFQWLINKGCDIRITYNEESPVIILAAKNDQDDSKIMSYLLDNLNQDKIFARDKNGRTALMIASSLGNVNILKCLLDYHWKNCLESLIEDVDNDDWTSMMNAVRKDGV